MKILYLILGAPSEGVKKKIYDKARFLRKAHGDVSILIVLGNRDEFNGDNQTDLLRVDRSPVSFLPRMPFFWRLSVVVEQRQIYRAVAAYLSNKHYDLILMRYPVADYFLHRFVKRVSRKGRIVFEHNTLEVEELRLRSADSFWYKYFLWGERAYGKKVRSQAAGIIGVTDEIRIAQVAVAGGKIPSVTISNGIDISRVKVKTQKDRKLSKLVNLVFLAGSQAPWHGVDILLNSLAYYNGSTTFHCYIAGDIDKELSAQARRMSNVSLLPHQSLASLDKLIDQCDIGVGSLALYRNNMKEACTLKVREYWARGLPFIIGYDDSDLMNNASMAPFYIKVPIQQNDNLPFFDMELIASFADQVLNTENIHSRMRSLAMEHISYPAKAHAYLSFFKSLPS
jgi:hypothetical protein